MEKKTSKSILLAIMGVLILVMIIVEISAVNGYWIPAICLLVSLVFVALYGFSLYKKPHGNMLKIAMLLFAAANFITTAYLLSIGSGNMFFHIVNLIATGVVCYGAGRLNRIEQNRVIFAVTDIVFLIISILFVASAQVDLSFLTICKLFVDPVIFTTLMIAYFVRYKEHKEAGLMDAPKE